jgi:hypothetical protein
LTLVPVCLNITCADPHRSRAFSQQQPIIHV